MTDYWDTPAVDQRDEHVFGLRGVPGSRDLVITCTCGWESEPVHLSNAELMRARHRAEVGARA